MAEHQRGGISTEEMHYRYEEGINPGGLSGQAPRQDPDVEEGRKRESHHAHPYDDEPTDSKVRRPGHSRYMPSRRAGS